MQYLLTDDEMATIRRERADALKMPNLEALTNVVKHVACQMAEVGSDLPNGRKPTNRPHGCIHVDREACWYCDRCPVAGICPLPKDWSK